MVTRWRWGGEAGQGGGSEGQGRAAGGRAGPGRTGQGMAEKGKARKAYRKLEARTYFHKHILLVGLSFELGEG